MENRTFASFSNASPNDDGLHFNLTIDTLQEPVPIEASVADIGNMIHLFSKVSWPRVISSVCRSTSAVTAPSACDRSTPLVMMLVGATTLAYALDTPKPKGFSQQHQTTVEGLL